VLLLLLLSARSRLLRAKRRKHCGEKQAEQERSELPALWAHENLLAATEVSHYQADQYARLRATSIALDFARKDKQAGVELSTMLSLWQRMPVIARAILTRAVAGELEEIRKGSLGCVLMPESRLHKRQNYIVGRIWFPPP
jgi:hypothetical protein